MPGITNYAATEFLRAALIGSSYAFPTSWWLGLFTVTPTPSTNGTEVAFSDYGRLAITFNAPAGTPRGCLGPTTQIQFSATSNNWGTVVAWGILDATTSGNLWFFGPTSTPRLMNIGNQITYPINSLNIQSG
jgi:hypothetical protein